MFLLYDWEALYLHHVLILHTSLSRYIQWHLTNIPIDLEILTVETEHKMWGENGEWHATDDINLRHWFRIGVSVPVILIVIILPSLKWYKTKDLNNKQYLNCSRTYDNHLHYCDVWRNKLKADKSYRLKTRKWSCCSIRTNISHQWITLQYQALWHSHKSCNPLNRKKLQEQNFHSPLGLHQKSLGQSFFPLAHQAIPFFLLPCPPFFPIRLPFSFLACRWFIHTGYWPLSSNRVFLLRLLSMSIFPSVKDKDYLVIFFLLLSAHTVNRTNRSNTVLMEIYNKRA